LSRQQQTKPVAGGQLFFAGVRSEGQLVVAGAVVKVEIRALADFQAQWESPALGLFHEVSFSMARLPTNSAIEPFNGYA
jgi:hypothetical protein